MNTLQHPTPWLLDTSDGKRRIVATNAETGIQYAVLHDDSYGVHVPDNETLARIVQRVNAHDVLVAAGKELLEAFDNTERHPRDRACYLQLAVASVRDAIAKAGASQ